MDFKQQHFILSEMVNFLLLLLLSHILDINLEDIFLSLGIAMELILMIQKHLYSL